MIRASLLALALWLSAVAALGCGASLVGEQCAPGYAEKDGTCVLPSGPSLCGGGSAVVLGMDFSAIAPGTPEAHLLGNAVFGATPDPVRVLDYRALAEWNSSSATNVVDLIAAEAVARDRTLQTTVAHDAAELGDLLQKGEHDLLFVHDQTAAPEGELAAVGAAWAPLVAGFVRTCGDVVVLATAGGTGEMGELLSAAGILDTGALSPAAAVVEVAPGDPLLSGVAPPFAGEQGAASFALDPASKQAVTVVLATPDHAPVALRRAF
jgi:hypothetical protein